MSIVLITGDAGSGKTLVANALRNNQINQRHGALLVDEGSDGAPVHLLEKIIDGDPLKPGTPADKVKWKPHPMIILVGGEPEKLVAVFEGLCPGITSHLGPVYTIETGKA